ncbi:MAG: hypothetical protein WDM77_02875 [Steroidobacteraceae bacterium]
MLIVVAGVCGVLLVEKVGSMMHLRVMGRLLPLRQSLILGFACIAAHVVYIISVYLRTHKTEPLVWLSLTNAVVMIVLLSVLTPLWGALGVVLAYAVVNLLVALPIAWLILERFRTAVSKGAYGGSEQLLQKIALMAAAAAFVISFVFPGLRISGVPISPASIVALVFFPVALRNAYDNRRKRLVMASLLVLAVLLAANAVRFGFDVRNFLYLLIPLSAIGAGKF